MSEAGDQSEALISRATSTNSLPRGSEHVERQSRSCNYVQVNDAEANTDIDVEGKIYEKLRDPPGQKCVYILPGDSERESYRLSTYMKFPQEIPVDPRLLARHGFYYTGYKDRVKCFSCGSNVYDWKVFDNPRDARWHFDGCKMVLQTETRNISILSKPITFNGTFTSSVQSLDSGYGTSSSSSCRMSSNEHTMTQNARKTIAADATKPAVPSSSSSSHESEMDLSRSISVMQIGNDSNVIVNGTNKSITIHNDHSNVPNERQTAQIVPQKPNGVKRVEGLNFATIISSYHQELLTKVLNLHREDDRRKSFFGWALFITTVTPDHLAKSGFFYLGNSDRVQCFSCSGVLRNWKENDDVEEQHSTHFPHCKMVMLTEIRNIPIPDSVRTTKVRKSVSPVEPLDPSPEEQESLKRQFPCLYPVNPHMRNIEDRFQTFDQRWPRQKVNATVQHITKAGFYFLGDRDRAKCWYCNGGLQNWEPNDEPFTEHAKWFPGCEYILQCKGVDFVKQVVTKFPSLRRPALRNPRFDHRTGKIISVTPNPDQQQPVVVDPRANVSAGSVLRNHTSSGSQNSCNANGVAQSQSANEEMESTAENMGFERAIIKRVIERQIRNKGKNFDDVQQLVDALLQEPSTSSSVDFPPPEATMRVGPIEGLQEVQVYENPSQSLKRNSGTNEEVNNPEEPVEGETPLKRTKTGDPFNKELATLENNRRCKLCRNNTADRVLMPCGHLSLCSSCGNEAKICPICKFKIQSFIKAYVV